MAVWDYGGKLEAQGWSRIQQQRVLKAQLCPPPAKMLRCFVEAACDALLLKIWAGVSAPCNEKAAFGLVGLLSDVPFTPLEKKVTTCVAAAQADDAEVDLAAWDPSNETLVKAKARETLQQFAVCW
jgi:hypothetical protein